MAKFADLYLVDAGREPVWDPRKGFFHFLEEDNFILFFYYSIENIESKTIEIVL